MFKKNNNKMLQMKSVLPICYISPYIWLTLALQRKPREPGPPCSSALCWKSPCALISIAWVNTTYALHETFQRRGGPWLSQGALPGNEHTEASRAWGIQKKEQAPPGTWAAFSSCRKGSPAW